jgi:glutamyl-tRNA synthetase
MKGTPISKRTLKKLLEEGIVTGWDDPRMPTLAALRRRGYSPQAIREFIMSMGVKKTESEPTWDMIETFNRRILDPIAKRYFFVPEPVKLTVEAAPTVTVTLKYHPDRKMGERRILTSGSFFISRGDAERLNIGDRFRLLELYEVEAVRKSEAEVVGKYVGNEVKSKLKIQWVTETSSKLQLMIPGPLYLDDHLNPESLKMVNGLIEEAGTNIKVGEQFQSVRVGFCKLDADGVAILTHR